MIDVLYILAALPRTGSGLMSDIFNGAGIPTREIYKTDQFAPKLAKTVRGAGDVIGIKPIFEHMLNRAIQPDKWLDLLIARIGARRNVWVYMDRHDKVRQALSYERAVLLKEWHSFDSVKSLNVKPRTLNVQQRLRWMQQEQLWWAAYFATRNITPRRLFYEDWTKDQDAIVGTAEELLHLSGHHYNGQGRMRRKQADSDVEPYVQQMYEDILRWDGETQLDE